MGKIEEKQRNKRKEIALNALPFIAQYGFLNFSIANLCRKINISVGSFYHYFRDKNDIIMELFMLIDDYYRTYVHRQALEHPNKLYSIKLFCIKYAYYCLKCGLEVCRQVSLVPLISFEQSFMSNTRYISELLLSVIEVGQKAGQISVVYTPAQLCNVFIVAVRGYCFDWCKHNASYDLVAAIELHCHMLLRQIAADPALCEQAIALAVEDDKDFHFYPSA